MKIIIALIPILILVSSCNYSTPKKPTDEKALASVSVRTIHEETAYALINDFILDSLYKTNLLAIEAMQFYNTELDTSIVYDFGRFCSYDSTLFQELIKLNIIDSLDLKSISTLISKKEQLEWDSTRVRVKTFSFYQLEELVRNNLDFDPYEYTKNVYNTSNFLILSYPIFLNDNAILVAGSFFCEGLCGHGEIYVFSMKNGKWAILYEDWRWIS